MASSSASPAAKAPSDAEAHTSTVTAPSKTSTAVTVSPKPEACSSASPTPSKTPESTTVVVSPTVRKSLWEEAYDTLKEDEASLVDAYEHLLSTNLNSMNSNSDQGSGHNANTLTTENHIEQNDTEKRRAQMALIIQVGLQRIEKEISVKKSIDEVTSAIEPVNSFIEKAAKVSPEVRIVWVWTSFAQQVGHTFFTTRSMANSSPQILANPVRETLSNHKGIAYVLSRMDWYCALSDLLFNNDNSHHDPAANLRDQLKKSILKLYKELLSFQMKSVRYYYRNRKLAFLRDMMKLDDWVGSLESVQKVERTFQEDVSAYDFQIVKSHSSGILETTSAMEKTLAVIRQALETQTATLKSQRMEALREECMVDLLLSDPSLDKKRIETEKGGLIPECSEWILDILRQWQEDGESKLFWIKGDPGKGKTMLMVAIINEIKRQLAEQPVERAGTIGLAFFLCQGTNKTLNNITAVLRGLIYSLVSQCPSLLSHLQEEYKTARQKLFMGQNVYYSLINVLQAMLNDPNLIDGYIIIDALDECALRKDNVPGLQNLLAFIIRNTSTSSKIKWIVSSRNEPVIVKGLSTDASITPLNLELDDHARNTSAAVKIYIENQLSKLSVLEHKDPEKREKVKEQLLAKSKGTFLWVALVVQTLQELKVAAWDRILKFLDDIPEGLDALYDRMLVQIRENDQACQSEYCEKVLAAMTVAYSPLHLEEIGVLAELPSDLLSKESAKDVVSHCGSFLTISNNDYVYFIHQSAKDYFTKSPRGQTLFPLGIPRVHLNISARAMEAISRVVKQDIYNLCQLGVDIAEVTTPHPDPLATIRYACLNWIEHFCDGCDGDAELRETTTLAERALSFFKKSCIYWIEALCLIRGTSSGLLSTKRLTNWLLVSYSL